jgi:hypothetical protein
MVVLVSKKDIYQHRTFPYRKLPKVLKKKQDDALSEVQYVLGKTFRKIRHSLPSGCQKF